MIRKEKGFFKITKRGKQLRQEHLAAKLFTLLFLTYFQKLNIAFFDRIEENDSLQDTILYSFYKIGTLLNDWKKPEEVARDVMYPSALNCVHGDNDLVNQIEMRIFWPLVLFGLLETKQLPKNGKWGIPKTLYRKTELFDWFLRFNID
ncbi:hypothetical protein GF373_07380 [bacterium]|nr:hypothetical protein [bacterium]